MKFFIKSFGCPTNYVESDILREILLKNDWEEAENENEADYIFVFTCGVKNQTEKTALKYIKSLPKEKLFVVGCLPDIIPDKLKELGIKYFFGPREYSKKFKEYLNIDYPEIVTGYERLEKEYIHTIIISQGCLGNCAYCAVKLARKNLFSYPIECILKEFKYAVKKGALEIRISSQDNAIYGLDQKTNLVKLLKELLKIEGNYMIRIGMGNPKHYLKLLDEGLIEILKHKNVFKYLHIPVQSGSNKVLKDMNRMHTKEDFIELVKQLRKEIPDITIATDVIVGYPTETDEDFYETYELIKETEPVIINISRFGMRPNTEAWRKYKDLPGQIKKERSRILTKLHHKILLKWNHKMLNKTEDCVVVDKKRGYFGRFYNYRPVILDENYLGKRIKVKIYGYSERALKGKVLEHENK